MEERLSSPSPRAELSRRGRWACFAAAASLIAVAVVEREPVLFGLENLPSVLFDVGAYGELEERRLGQRARELLRERRLEEARAVLVRSLAIDPRSDLVRDLAELELEAGRLDEAERRVRAHLASFPADGLGWLLLDEVTRRRGASDEERRASLREGRERVRALLDERRRLEEPNPDPRSADKHRRHVRSLEIELESLDASLRGLSPGEPPP